MRACAASLALVASSVLAPLAATASSPAFLVKDINAIEPGDAPRHVTRSGGRLYFSETTSLGGRRAIELWTSDGTAASTLKLKQIDSTSADIELESIEDVGGAPYFVIVTRPSDGGPQTRERWKSDGTEQGTVSVPFLPASSPLTSVNGTLFFAMDDGTHGTELWKSDGSAAGTHRVKDIAPGSASSHPNALLDVGGTLVFFANADGAGHVELWTSDGSEAGTVLLTPIDIAPATSVGASFAGAHGTVLFRTADPVPHPGLCPAGAAEYGELWSTNGTLAGTLRLADCVGPGLNLAGGLLYFSRSERYLDAGWNSLLRQQLWRTDGTPGGTVALHDFDQVDPYGAPPPVPSSFTDVNGALYFLAGRRNDLEELWKSDGSPGGTAFVAAVGSYWDGTHTTLLTNGNGTLFFVVHDASRQTRSLWSTDGTPPGTRLLRELELWPFPLSSLASLNGSIFFGGWDLAHGGELWKSDGSPPGTLPLTNRALHGTASSNPRSMVSLNGALYFAAHDTIDTGHGSPLPRLWKTDGSEPGTVVLDGVSDVSGLSAFAGRLYFDAVAPGSPARGRWRTDGTQSGTEILPFLPASTEYVEVNGTLFFVRSANDRPQLWKTDGTEPGTVLVKALDQETALLDVLTDVNGTLFFRRRDVDANELWKSDGTESGTVLVRSFSPGPPDPIGRAHGVSDLVNVNGTLYFRADEGVHGYELWKSDGTQTGTVLVEDILPGPGWGYPSELTDVNGMLFFRAQDGVNGMELWKSDGSAAGTAMVKDLFPGAGWGHPDLLTRAGGALFFRGFDGARLALWKSDGSEAGTVELTGESAGSILLHGLRNVHDRLLFLVEHGTGLSELWTSDGSAGGTRALTAFGPNGGLTGELMPAGAHVFFSASTPSTGNEPFALPLSVVVPDADADGVPDAADNCPFTANADQTDRGGIGVSAAPDGIGDVCQCGDVTGDGIVSAADAIVISRSLLVPPSATMARPELCDVAADRSCTLADAIVIRRALLSPPTASVAQVCGPAR